MIENETQYEIIKSKLQRNKHSLTLIKEENYPTKLIYTQSVNFLITTINDIEQEIYDYENTKNEK